MEIINQQKNLYLISEEKIIKITPKSEDYLMNVLNIDSYEINHEKQELIITATFDDTEHEAKIPYETINFKEINEENKEIITELLKKKDYDLVMISDEELFSYSKEQKQLFHIKPFSSRKKVNPSSLFFGYEIEFNDDSGESGVLKRLQETFKVGEYENNTQNVVINGGTITINTNGYESRSDVVRAYRDGSVDFEIVTRPFSLNEIKEKIDRITTHISSVCEPDYECGGKAGGHITFMDGQHLEIPLNDDVIKNFIQLTRVFFPQIVFLSNETSQFRGVYYYKINCKQSSDSNYTTKYSCVNKKFGKNNKVCGMEMRSFCSPETGDIAEVNAKIITALWRTAEKITEIGTIVIKQERIDKVKSMFSNHENYNLYDKRDIVDSEETLASQVFYELIKSEVQKLKIEKNVLKRLLLAEKSDELTEQQVLKIQRDYYSLLIDGKNSLEAINDLIKKYEFSKEQVSKAIDMLN